jgi:hypothetical protein
VTPTRTRFATALLVAAALLAMIGCERSQPGPKPISGHGTAHSAPTLIGPYQGQMAGR